MQTPVTQLHTTALCKVYESEYSSTNNGYYGGLDELIKSYDLGDDI